MTDNTPRTAGPRHDLSPQTRIFPVAPVALPSRKSGHLQAPLQPVHILPPLTSMGTIDLGELVAGIVKHWDGVEMRPCRFGVVEFRVNHREIGHVHLGGVADLLMPVRSRRDLVAAGRAEPHRTQPHSGWISFRMRSEHDVPAAVELFRLNYERLRGAVRPRIMTWLVTNPTMLGDRSADDLPA